MQRAHRKAHLAIWVVLPFLILLVGGAAIALRQFSARDIQAIRIDDPAKASQP